jgi:hypothetical protein
VHSLVQPAGDVIPPLPSLLGRTTILILCVIE